VTVEDLLQVACGWLGYDPLTAWKLSPREITFAFKGWEAKTKYLVSIDRNLLLGHALKVIAPHVKGGQQLHKDADKLFTLPWEQQKKVKAPTKKELEQLNRVFPKQLPDWANGSK
jgi:hypothetical protein